MQIAGPAVAAPPIVAAAPVSTSPAPVGAPPSPDQPSVTVTLSDAAIAALASPAGPATTSGAAAPGGIVAQVQQLAATLEDTSGASDADKATAFADLYQLRFESGGDGTDPSMDEWFTESTPDQQKAVESEIEGSTFFKQAVSAATLFNGAGIETARSGLPFDPTKTEAARFSQLSPDQQLLVWAGGASQFASLADFKTYLAQQAQGQAAAARDLKSTAPAGAGAASDDGAAAAVKTLATTPTGTTADVALTLLKKAAAAQAAKAKHPAPTDPSGASSAAAPSPAPGAATASPGPSAAQPYEQGTIVSVAA
ncbi:MAG TPA: hypothetical protein VHW60_15250 [Caulobacteraceae bacterium]|jgi:hypothetical protein|nr:hypothetical protein [Caulobacteraceae bacterium]